MWSQRSVDTREPVSLQRKLSQKLLSTCVPNVFQADTYKFNLLTEHTHTEGAQLSSLRLKRNHRHVHSKDVEALAPMLQSAERLLLHRTPRWGRHGSRQCQGKNGCAAPGTRTSRVFCFHPIVLAVKDLDNAVIYIINILCPEAKNFYKTDKKRFLTMYVFSDGAGVHHSKYMPYKTRYWSMLL